MKTDEKDIGIRIRKARKEKGMTQEELAEKLDISTTHISHIETGKGKPSIDIIIELMDALDISPDQLFCGVVGTAKNQLSGDLAGILSDCGPNFWKLVSSQTLMLKESMGENSKK